MIEKPCLPEGEVTLRWKTREDGSLYIEGHTNYPPKPGESWSRGNDLCPEARSFGRTSIENALDEVRDVLVGRRI